MNDQNDQGTQTNFDASSNYYKEILQYSWNVGTDQLRYKYFD
jgi:hypothetical protein